MSVERFIVSIDEAMDIAIDRTVYFIDIQYEPEELISNAFMLYKAHGRQDRLPPHKYLNTRYSDDLSAYLETISEIYVSIKNSIESVIGILGPNVQIQNIERKDCIISLIVSY